MGADGASHEGDNGERGGDGNGGTEESVSVPLDGDVLQYAGATASVAPGQLGPLLRRVQSTLGGRIERYRRAYECAVDDGARAAFLCPADHWGEVGAELGLTDAEVAAVERAHAQQLRRLGTKTGRREELETALEIRAAVVIGHGGTGEE